MNLDTFKSNEMSNKKFIVTQYLFIYLSFILVQNMRIDTCRLRMYLSTTGILKAHSREQQQKNSEQILK